MQSSNPKPVLYVTQTPTRDKKFKLKEASVRRNEYKEITLCNGIRAYVFIHGIIINSYEVKHEIRRNLRKLYLNVDTRTRSYESNHIRVVSSLLYRTSQIEAKMERLCG
jgi:hypothetical protein